MPMTKAQNPKLPEWEGLVSGIWSFDFDIVSDFEFRISDLCFPGTAGSPSLARLFTAPEGVP